MIMITVYHTCVSLVQYWVTSASQTLSKVVYVNSYKNMMMMMMMM